MTCYVNQLFQEISRKIIASPLPPKFYLLMTFFIGQYLLQGGLNQAQCLRHIKIHY